MRRAVIGIGRERRMAPGPGGCGSARLGGGAGAARRKRRAEQVFSVRLVHQEGCT